MKISSDVSGGGSLGAERELKHIKLASTIEGLECAVDGLQKLDDMVRGEAGKFPPKREAAPGDRPSLKGLSLASFLDTAPKEVHELEARINNLVDGIRKALF